MKSLILLLEILLILPLFNILKSEFWFLDHESADTPNGYFQREEIEGYE